MISKMNPCKKDLDGSPCGGTDFSIQETDRKYLGALVIGVTRSIRCNKCGYLEVFSVNFREFVENEISQLWNDKNPL